MNICRQGTVRIECGSVQVIKHERGISCCRSRQIIRQTWKCPAQCVFNEEWVIRRNLANEIHSDLAKGILYAVDVRNGLRLPINYLVKDRDVLSIIWQ